MWLSQDAVRYVANVLILRCPALTGKSLPTNQRIFFSLQITMDIKSQKNSKRREKPPTTKHQSQQKFPRLPSWMKETASGTGLLGKETRTSRILKTTINFDYKPGSSVEGHQSLREQETRSETSVQVFLWFPFGWSIMDVQWRREERGKKGE